MGILLFIRCAIILRVVFIKRGPGYLLWICIALTLVSAGAAVFQLQAMVPDSWVLGLWVIGLSSLMLMVVPLPVSGRSVVLARVVVCVAVLAYPAWLGMQMGMVYFAIQSEDSQAVHQRVDFEAMREEVEHQLTAHFEAVDASRDGDEPEEQGVLASVKATFLSGARESRRWLVKKVAKGILTPQGLKQMMNQDSRSGLASGRPWNERLRIERFDSWKIWTNWGWVGFEQDDANQRVRVRSIEFSEDFLNRIEQAEDDVG